ncbi:MAG: hypothetical protein AB7K71_32495 [Polyangiaceae bacterium]
MSERLITFLAMSGLSAGAVYHQPAQPVETRLSLGIGSETPLPSTIAPVALTTTLSGPQRVVVDAEGSKRARVVREAAGLVQAIVNILPIDHEADARTTRLINERRASRKIRKLTRKNG